MSIFGVSFPIVSDSGSYVYDFCLYFDSVKCPTHEEIVRTLNCSKQKMEKFQCPYLRSHIDYPCLSQRYNLHQINSAIEAVNGINYSERIPHLKGSTVKNSVLSQTRWGHHYISIFLVETVKIKDDKIILPLNYAELLQLTSARYGRWMIKCFWRFLFFLNAKN